MSLSKSAGKALLAAAIAGSFGLISSSASAVVFPDFQVQEGSVPGASTNLFTADKITGNYAEVITFTFLTTTTGTFDVSLKWQAGQFVQNDGVDPIGTQLTSPGGFVASNQYAMYALYSASGTFSISGLVTTFSATAGSGGLSVYIDPSVNTTFTAPGTGTSLWGTANTVDDYLIATGSVIGGGGTLDPTLNTCSPNGPPGGINCGSFGNTTSFALTSAVGPDGKEYFVFPDPFYNLSFQSGQLNNFTVSGTQNINGSMDVVFSTVPEPESLALVGLGLLGLGVSRRRKA